jgi:hypothetical protein
MQTSNYKFRNKPDNLILASMLYNNTAKKKPDADAVRRFFLIQGKLLTGKDLFQIEI